MHTVHMYPTNALKEFLIMRSAHTQWLMGSGTKNPTFAIPIHHYASSFIILNSELWNKYHRFAYSTYVVEVAQLVKHLTFTHFCGSNPSSGEIFISVSVRPMEKFF